MFRSEEHGVIGDEIETETKWPPFRRRYFKCIYLNEKVWISIKISLNFVPKGRINNIPALVQIMAWRRLGDKPLSEPMVVSLLTHICAIRHQRVKIHFQAVIVYYDNANPPKQNTAVCRYNAVQYDHVLNKTLQWLRQNINQSLFPQKNIPYLAIKGDLWGVFCENFGENWLRYNSTSLWCFGSEKSNTCSTYTSA